MMAGMNTNDADRPDDLISLKAACQLAPSPYGGSVHVNTMRRWCLSGKLRYWRNGHWLFVRRADVLALFQEMPEPAPRERQPPPGLQRARVREILRRHGVVRD